MKMNISYEWVRKIWCVWFVEVESQQQKSFHLYKKFLPVMHKMKYSKSYYKEYNNQWENLGKLLFFYVSGRNFVTISFTDTKKMSTYYNVWMSKKNMVWVVCWSWVTIIKVIHSYKNFFASCFIFRLPMFHLHLHMWNVNKQAFVIGNN